MYAFAWLMLKRARMNSCVADRNGSTGCLRAASLWYQDVNRALISRLYPSYLLHRPSLSYQSSWASGVFSSKSSHCQRVSAEGAFRVFEDVKASTILGGGRSLGAFSNMNILPLFWSCPRFAKYREQAFKKAIISLPSLLALSKLTESKL